MRRDDFFQTGMKMAKAQDRQVEKLLATRRYRVNLKKSVTEYLVCWKGCAEEGNSWVECQHLNSSLVQAFHAEHNNCTSVRDKHLDDPDPIQGNKKSRSQKSNNKRKNLKKYNTRNSRDSLTRTKANQISNVANHIEDKTVRKQMVKKMGLKGAKTPPSRKANSNISNSHSPIKGLTLPAFKNIRRTRSAERPVTLGDQKTKTTATQKKIKKSSLQNNPSKPRQSKIKGRLGNKVERKDDHVDSSSSDDDILYSLAETFEGKKTTTTSAANTKKQTKSLSTKVPTTGTAQSVKVEQKSVIANGTSGTPESDLEISFKLSPSKKLLLKDSIRPKSDLCKDGMIRSPHTSPLKSASGKSTPSRQLAPCYENLSAFSSMLPMIPNSPSALSYQMLVKNLSKNLQGGRGLKRKAASLGEEQEPLERRSSVRTTECTYKYKEIVVRKYQGYTQVWLLSQSKLRNSLNPRVFQELIQVFHNARFDDSRLVMLSGSGSIFCSGVDLYFLTAGDKKVAAKSMAEGIRDFVNTLIAFPKPVVAAVNGPAIGLGVAILPLCDIVYASDKASFYCPYSRLAQTPEGCSSFTFPQVMGSAMAYEMLLAGRKLTAIEACQVGLVSQVFWPTSLMQEVVPRVQHMAQCSAKALEGTKILMRSHQRSKLQCTIDNEQQLLADRWISTECQRAMKTYLDDEKDLLN